MTTRRMRIRLYGTALPGLGILLGVAGCVPPLNRQPAGYRVACRTDVLRCLPQSQPPNFDLLVSPLFPSTASYAKLENVWRDKSKPAIFRLIQNPIFDMKKLHGAWAPINLRTPKGFPILDVAVYHLHLITRKGQVCRVQKYETLDPSHEFQKIGYDYMLNIQGLRAESLPKGREYEPIEPPHEYRVDSLQSSRPVKNSP